MSREACGKNDSICWAVNGYTRGMFHRQEDYAAKGENVGVILYTNDFADNWASILRHGANLHRHLISTLPTLYLTI